MSSTAGNDSASIPGRAGGLVGVFDSLKLIADPLGFLKKWRERHGMVFQTTQFFRPTVVLGDPKAVEDFSSKEADITGLALPEAFRTLQTEYSSLNQDGDRLKASRKIFQGILNSEKYAEYLPAIEQSIDRLLDTVADKGEMLVADELDATFLQLFGRIFCGRSLSLDDIQMFKDYNTGLFALGLWDPQFKTAQAALGTLVAANIEALQQARARDFSGPLDGMWKVLTASVDETGHVISDERCATAGVIFTWGAYAEQSALCGLALVELGKRPDIAERVRAEARAAGVLGASAPLTLPGLSSLPYADAVLNEVLRYHCQTGGGFRAATADLEIAGYKIPKGTVVSPDTRLPNLSPDYHPSPDTFEPARWVLPDQLPSVTGETAKQCPFTGAAASLSQYVFFPGGTGAHQCPGIPLAMLVGRLTMVKWLDRFDSWGPDDPAKPVPMVEIPIRRPAAEYKITLKLRA